MTSSKDLFNDLFKVDFSWALEAVGRELRELQGVGKASETAGRALKSHLGGSRSQLGAGLGKSP